MDLADCEILANYLLERHGLRKGYWRFRFDSAKRRFGLCSYERKIISLSKHLVELNSDEEVEECLLHEMAHALAGPGTGHGEVWKAKCLEIGCKPNACYNYEAVKVPEGKWKGTCPGCSTVFHQHRRPKTRKSCSDCGGGSFNLAYLIHWTYTGDKLPQLQQEALENLNKAA
jgi:predicted SprT family Zn-dependent metalloprotease